MKLYSFALIAVLCLFLSCQNHDKESLKQLSADQKDIAVAPSGVPKNEESTTTLQGLVAADTAVLPNNTPAAAPKAPAAVTHEDWDRKIIRTADLQLELKDYHAFDQSYRDGIRKLGGYIAKEEQHQSDDRIDNNVSIRVPVASFEEAIRLLTGSAQKIIEKKVSSEDVGSQIVDTKSRIEARKHIRDRYLDMLKQAKNMEEILQVQQEINEQQETIESAAGRVNYLSHAAAYSTINLSYYQVLQAVPDMKEPGYGARFWEALKNGWSVIANIGLALANIWPMILLLLGGIWLLYRKAAKKAAAPVATK